MLSLGDSQVATASFLLKQGYSYENLKGYVKSGYLDALGRGAYCRVGAHPSVEDAITAISSQLDIPVHLGGRTALALDPSGSLRSDIGFASFNGLFLFAKKHDITVLRVSSSLNLMSDLYSLPPRS